MSHPPNNEVALFYQTSRLPGRAAYSGSGSWMKR